jgi:hypothetical protein
MQGALGQVGAQTGRHAKVLNDGRTGVKVEPRRPKESDHIIGVHGCTMPKTHASKVREQSISSCLLDHQVQHIHDRVEEKRGEGIPLSQSTPVVDKVTGYAIHQDPRRGGPQ